MSDESASNAGQPLGERVVLAAAPVLFAFFSTREARDLRLVSSLFEEAVGDTRWEDKDTAVANILLWRQCFPRARAVKFARLCATFDRDLRHLIGVESVDFSGVDIDDFHLGMLSPLSGTIKEIDLRQCAHITDRGISVLREILTLDMSWCRQSTITDKAFENLQGIHTLKMVACNQKNL